MRIGLLAAAALLLSGAAPADDFTRFWTGFRAAVANGDAQAIAARTALPFLFGGRQLAGRDFVAAVPELFDAGVRACFRDQTPIADGEQRMLFCRGTIFLFAPTPDGWRFTEIGIDD